MCGQEIVFFLSFTRKRNVKGTQRERAMNLGIIEWKTGGGADMTAQQAWIGEAAKNKYLEECKNVF